MKKKKGFGSSKNISLKLNNNLDYTIPLYDMRGPLTNQGSAPILPRGISYGA